MRWMLVASALAVAIGCGPKKGPDGGGGGGGGGGGNGSGSASGSSTGSSTGTGGGSAGGGDAAPLTRADCERMIDHVLEVGMAEQRKQKPAELVPTEEQVAKIRAGLVAQQLAPCLAWPRPVWECTMAAPTVASLYSCAEGDAE